MARDETLPAAPGDGFGSDRARQQGGDGEPVLSARPLRERPIGIFDSGVGGLTVLKALGRLLPGEDFLYLGDTARVPYGSRSRDTIVRYSLENAGFLVEQGIKLLVVACNTSSAAALEAIAAAVPAPVIGVVEPGARAAVQASAAGRIAVVGTEATIASDAYARTIRRLSPGAEVYSRACPLLVPLAEEGWLDNDVAERVVAYYVEGFAGAAVDTLLLGCTHYPLLRPLFARVLGPAVRIVDSAEATAQAVSEFLAARQLGRPDALGRRGERHFFVTDAPERFVRVGRLFLGPEVVSAIRVER